MTSNDHPPPRLAVAPTYTEPEPEAAAPPFRPIETVQAALREGIATKWRAAILEDRDTVTKLADLAHAHRLTDTGCELGPFCPGLAVMQPTDQFVADDPHGAARELRNLLFAAISIIVDARITEDQR